MKQTIIAGAVAIGALAAWPQAQQPPPASQPPVPQQPTEVGTTISSEGGAAPRFAVPDFIALTKDAETVAIAKTIGQVLWDDLNFEREFAFIPRDVYASIPAATSFADVPFDRWREVNADGVIVGTVQKVGTAVKVEMRLLNARTRLSAYSRQYDGSAANPRAYAHTMSDELHKSQRALNGVARSKLTFDSDRDGERMSGTVEKRGVKEIYISDYDGENQRRVTVGKTLNITPRWSPDGRSIAYTSYRRGGGQIFISNIFQGTLDEVTRAPKDAEAAKGERVGENWLPAWSPDGTRLAFTSTRDGNPEIYVANRDGSDLRRLTNHPGIDITPTWSPSGTQVAFTSDRSGSPQIYIVSADGVGAPNRVTSESYCDKPTWSPAPYNEIAYASRSGPGYDIKIIDLATRHVTGLTFGEGTNESPAYSPNGRHIAFMSTRSGKSQIFTVARDGKNVRQITRTGNNEQPDWSR
jgi:TolB protein